MGACPRWPDQRRGHQSGVQHPVRKPLLVDGQHTPDYIRTYIYIIYIGLLKSLGDEIIRISCSPSFDNSIRYTRLRILRFISFWAAFSALFFFHTQFVDTFLQVSSTAIPKLLIGTECTCLCFSISLSSLFLSVSMSIKRARSRVRSRLLCSRTSSFRFSKLIFYIYIEGGCSELKTGGRVASFVPLFALLSTLSATGMKGLGSFPLFPFSFCIPHAMRISNWTARLRFKLSPFPLKLAWHSCLLM